MKFIENKGQWDKHILYTSQRDGLNTVVSNSGIYFDFYSIDENRVKGDVIKLNLAGSNPFSFTPLHQSEEKYNYFLGNDNSKWVTGVSSYTKLIAENVYDGIDFVYYIDNNNPRYDFIVEPYASVEQIAIKFDGIQNIELNNGNIKLETLNKIIENANLLAYQVINDKKTIVDCKFQLLGDKVSFKVGNYDKSKNLIIDPVIYSSYFGANGDDVPSKVKYIDPQHFLLVGSTTSSDFKTTPGSYDDEYGDRADAFITKFKIVNAEYIPEFTTYLGSLEYDVAVDMQLTNDYILVTGITESPDFPTKNAIKSKHSGGKDIFVTSLSLDGSQLLQSTFYGGSGDDYVVSVDKDRNNYFLFLAYSNSNDITTMGGPSNTGYRGALDILLFSLQPSREAIDLSIYLGGLLDDVPTDLFVNPADDNIYITGYTKSSKGNDFDFPVYPERKFGTGGPYDETSNGEKDAFEMVLSAKAQDIIISGFLGGNGDDIGRGIWADDNSNIYVMGETYNNAKGADFPTTTGEKSVKGNSDIFIAKFDKLKSTAWGGKVQNLNYSTLISSSGNEILKELIKHPNLNKFDIIVASDGKFPKIDAATMKAKTNILFAEIDPSSGDVNYATSYGSNDDDFPVSFDLDKYGNYLIAGYTSSSEFPISANATQSKKASGKDIVLIRNSDSKLSLLDPPTNQILCVGSEVQILWSPSQVLKAEDGYEVAYSMDKDHKIFTTIASDLKKESYLWTVPEELSGKDSVIIRVTHNSGVYAQNLDYYKVNEKAKIKSFTLLTSDTVCIGGSVQFDVQSIGTNIKYTWFKDGKKIGETSTNQFTIDSLNFNSSGKYTVSVQSDCPPATPSENYFNIYVSPNTKVDSLAKEITKHKGETLEIVANAVGVDLQYIWQKDGKDLPAQEGAALKLSNLSLNDSGMYRCYVVGKCGVDSTNETKVIIETNNSVEDTYFDINTVAEVTQIASNLYSISPKASVAGYTVTLFDNLGGEIYRDNSSATTELNLNSYANGVYWLVITIKEKNYRTKLLKYN
jgi:hypothetical protein